MTPDRFRHALGVIRLSEHELARLTGYSNGAVRNWVRGLARIPEPIAAWLERRLAAWEADPPPQRESAG